MPCTSLELGFYAHLVELFSRYDEILLVLGNEMQFVFTDVVEAKNFLIDLRPAIVNEMRTIHFEWGVIFVPSRDPPRDKPKRSRPPFVELWQFATSLPRIREVVLWVDWLAPGDRLSMIRVVRFVDGEIVEGEDEVVKRLTVLPDMPPN